MTIKNIFQFPAAVAEHQGRERPDWMASNSSYLLGLWRYVYLQSQWHVVEIVVANCLPSGSGEQQKKACSSWNPEEDAPYLVDYSGKDVEFFSVLLNTSLLKWTSLLITDDWVSQLSFSWCPSVSTKLLLVTKCLKLLLVPYVGSQLSFCWWLWLCRGSGVDYPVAL